TGPKMTPSLSEQSSEQLDEASSHPISTIVTPLPVLPLAPSASRTKSPRLVLDHLAKAYRVLETTAQEAPFELNHLYVEMGSAGDKVKKMEYGEIRQQQTL
ncbi:Os06g0484400, partial [Oryza sativa Japonica Group]